MITQMITNFTYQTQADTSHHSFSPDFLSGMLQKFKATIDDPSHGFFHLTNDQSQINAVKEVYAKFAEKKYFVQVGIGGSALGPQMLVDSLQKNFEREFLFFDNVDSDYIYNQLGRIKDPKDAIFYIVSKSGGTAETISLFSIAMNWLRENGIEESEFSDYFVLCTDPNKGDLRELASEKNYTTLEVPSNVGGRFSVLTAVGLLPAIFAGIDIDGLYSGANKIKEAMLTDKASENPLLQCAAHLAYLMHHQGVSQTVIMPYSSKLKTMAFWFVQLWAESLGKTREDGTHIGLTPVPAYGATDQHSQMQLFMQGPRDKCLLFIEVKNHEHNFKIASDIDKSSFNKLKNFDLNQLLEAEFKGTLKALQESQRDFIHLEIARNDEESLGALILFFEGLTALMGHYLEVDPFNQPGVELGKVYAYEYLKKFD